MAFLRPEVSEAISRFRDAIIGVGISLLGVYLAIGGTGITSIIGTSLALAGALLVFAGIQRGRFRSGGGGAGIVHVDEGQVTYYGPLEGGSVVIEQIARVEYDTTAMPAPEWVLHDVQGNELRIPSNAEGAGVLFDVFATLSGMQTERMLASISSPEKRQVLIWQSERTALH